MAFDTARDKAQFDAMFVTRKWAPAMGGMETYSQCLVEELEKLISLNVVFLPGRADGSRPSAFSLLIFPLRVIRRWFSMPRAPYVLHIGDMAIWPIGLLAWLSRGKTRIVLSAHGTDVSYHRRKGVRGRLYGAYLNLGAKILRDATVIANSKATREVASETGWNCEQVIPLATKLQGLASDGSHDGTILFAGRLVKRKGAGWFIREVLPGLPDYVRLKVAGTVWDESEGRALEDARVEYLGRLESEELAHAYRNALCVVVPNIPLASGEYEGFGLVATEAASAGGVVVATACDGLHDAVIDGETGFLVRPCDVQNWHERILAIAHWSKQQRRDFLTRSQSHAAKHFSWSRVARQTLEAYGCDAVRAVSIVAAERGRPAH